MADFRIVIVVDPTQAVRGSRRVERSLTRAGNAADRTRSLIARAFAFVGAAAGVRQLVQIADSLTLMENRLQLVTKGSAEATKVIDELFNVANRTRAAFTTTAEIFTRTALSVKSLGVSIKESLQFTESLNQAIILSGATTREANAGMIQLSQGMASNTLRGDELRSVLEQLQVVADVLAKKLGVTRGELRVLGQQGKITARIMLEAFAEAREELVEKFARTIPTIGQSLTVLRNNVVKLVGDFDDSTGAVRILALAILDLADNLEIVARAAAAAAIALGIVFAIKGVGAAVAAVGRLTLALATNPIGALVVLVSLATGALIAFGDQISVSTGRLANLQDFGLATFEALSKAADSFIEFFGENFGFVGDLASDVFEGIELDFEGVVRAAARSVDGVVGFFKGAGRALAIAFDNLPTALELVFVTAFNGVLRVVQGFVLTVVEVFEKLPEVLEGIFEEAFDDIGVLFTDFINVLIEGINRVAKFAGLGAIETLKTVRKIGDRVTTITLEDFANFELKASKQAKQIGARMDQALADGIRDQHAAEDALDGILDRSEQLARERIERQRVAKAAVDAVDLAAQGPRTAGVQVPLALSKFITKLEQANTLLRLNTQEREIQKALFDAENAAVRKLTESEERKVRALAESNVLLKAQRAALDDLREPQEQYNQRIAALTSLLNEGAISRAEFLQGQRETRMEFLQTQTDMLSGVERGFLSVQQTVTDSASLMEQAIVGAFRGAEDALVNFVKTGKLDFASLANSIISDLSRIAIRRAILAPILGFVDPFFATAGPAATVAAPVPMANGGTIDVLGRVGVDRNTLSLNGEPVARVSRGETVAVQNRPSRSTGGGGDVRVQVIDQRSASAPPPDVSETKGPNGERILRVLVKEATDQMMRQGQFDGSMKQRYGVSPSLRRRS